MFAAALPVAIPLILAAVAIQPAPSAAPHTTAMSLLPLRYADLSPQAPAQLPEHSVVLTVEEDDTLDALNADLYSKVAAIRLPSGSNKIGALHAKYSSCIRIRSGIIFWRDTMVIRRAETCRPMC